MDKKQKSVFLVALVAVVAILALLILAKNGVIG